MVVFNNTSRNLRKKCFKNSEVRQFPTKQHILCQVLKDSKIFLDVQGLKFYLPHALLSGSDWRMYSAKQTGKPRKRKMSIQDMRAKGTNHTAGLKNMQTHPQLRFQGTHLYRRKGE